MPIEMLTYAALGARLKISPEAARSLSKRLQLPRSLSSNGKVLVSVDFAEIRHTPRPPSTRQPGNVALLTAKIEALQAEIARFEAMAASHRADFERERERSDKLMTNTMTLASVAMSARAKAVRLESELAARRSQFWMRLRTRRGAAASEQFRSNVLPRPEEPTMRLQSIPAAAGRVRTFAELADLVMFAALITAFVEFGIPLLVR